MPRLQPHRLARALALIGALAGAVLPASATELDQAWRGAARHDAGLLVEHAARLAGQSQRDLAQTLWRPRVGLTVGLGLAANDAAIDGARFSAPGFGSTTGVDFQTAQHAATRVQAGVHASLPLYSPERALQQRQLELAAERAELAWRAAVQAAMLRTAERYFALALADETVRVLERQLQAVRQAEAQAQDRFKVGAAPITDTHEARARLAALQAQRLAAQSQAQIARRALADATGLDGAGLAPRLPALARTHDLGGQGLTSLDQWIERADAGNPGIALRRLAVDAARLEAQRYTSRAATSIDLVAQLGRERTRGDAWGGMSAAQSGTQRMIGVQLSVPLATGGHLDAKQLEALRLLDKAEAELVQTRQEVDQHTRSAWLGVHVGAERVRALDDALTATLARADATRIGRDVGQRTTLDLLNAESDVANARLALAEARVALLVARLRLAGLAGTLDDTILRSVDAELAALSHGASS